MMIPTPRNRASLAGLTLLEMLLVATVLTVLAVLMAPTFGTLREQSRTTQCLNRIRQVGTLLTGAITERGGSLNVWYSGSGGGGEFWNTWLRQHHYVTDTDLEKLSCPSIPYPAETSGRHYGIYLADTATHLTDTRSPTGALLGRSYRINLRTMESPASTIFMGDSITSAGELSIRIFRSDSASFPSGAFHQRHRQQVNLYFYDGHAESARPERLYALGIRRVYDTKLQPVTLSP